jgi:hypothetical protein
MKQITNKVLTSARLKKMGKKKLIDLADSMATRLQWLHSVGKNEENPEQYKRLASELYHVAEIIEWKESVKKTKKYDFNK